MKKIKSIKKIGFLFIVAISLVSCEKRNEQKNITTNTIDYQFVNPKWVLVNSNYSDTKGNFGVLYQNENNQNEKMFIVQKISKANNSNGSNQWTGHLRKGVTNTDLAGNKQTIITTCAGNEFPKDCRTEVKKDKDGTIIGGTIVRK